MLSDSHESILKITTGVTIPFLTGVLSDKVVDCEEGPVEMGHNPLLNRGAFRPFSCEDPDISKAVTIPFLTGVLSDYSRNYYYLIKNCHNPLLNRGAFRRWVTNHAFSVWVTIPFLTGVLSDLIGLIGISYYVTIPFLTGVLSDIFLEKNFPGDLKVTIPFLTGVLSDNAEKKFKR